MKKSKLRLRIIVLVMALVLVFVSTAGAAPVKSGFELFDQKTTDQLDKPWTITFSQAVDKSTAIADNIYFTDVNNILVASELSMSADEKSVVVKPLSNYMANQEYRLYISNQVKAKQSEKFLNKALVMPFKAIASIPVDYLISISADYSEMVSNIKVTATSDVFTVKVDGVEMHYEGANNYSLGVKVTKGTAVTITAYDDQDQLLQTRTFKVQ
jgi:hypothetical protein